MHQQHLAMDLASLPKPKTGTRKYLAPSRVKVSLSDQLMIHFLCTGFACVGVVFVFSINLVLRWSFFFVLFI